MTARIRKRYRWSYYGNSIRKVLVCLIDINVFVNNTERLSSLFANNSSLSYSSGNTNEIEVRLISDKAEIYVRQKMLVDWNRE